MIFSFEKAIISSDYALHCIHDQNTRNYSIVLMLQQIIQVIHFFPILAVGGFFFIFSFSLALLNWLGCTVTFGYSGRNFVKYAMLERGYIG